MSILDIFRVRKKKKVTFSNPDGRPYLNIQNDDIYKLKQQGKSNRQIAKILDCSEGTIRNRLKSRNDL